MAPDRDALLEIIRAEAVVRGPVVLSSGLAADHYVDLPRVTLSGAAAPMAGRVMLDLTRELDYEEVGGLTLGADPLATAMLHAAAASGRRPTPSSSARKERRTGCNGGSRGRMSRAGGCWRSRTPPPPVARS